MNLQKKLYFIILSKKEVLFVLKRAILGWFVEEISAIIQIFPQPWATWVARFCMSGSYYTIILFTLPYMEVPNPSLVKTTFSILWFPRGLDIIR